MKPVPFGFFNQSINTNNDQLYCISLRNQVRSHRHLNVCGNLWFLTFSDNLICRFDIKDKKKSFTVLLAKKAKDYLRVRYAWVLDDMVDDSDVTNTGPTNGRKNTQA